MAVKLWERGPHAIGMIDELGVHGLDILTGGSELRDGVLVVSDFNDEEYRIDIERGRRTGEG